MKPLYRILIIVAIVIGGGFLLYFLWNTWVATPPEISPTPTSTTPLPINTGEVQPPAGETQPASEATIQKVSDNPVFSFYPTPAGSVMYFSEDGKAMLVRENADMELSPESIAALNTTELSPSGDRVLASFGNPLAPNWGIYDLIDHAWRPLPSEATQLIWSAKSPELIGIISQNGISSLVSFDPTKTPVKYTTYISRFSMKGVVLSTVSTSTLFIFEKPSGIFAGRGWSLNLKTLSLSKIFDTTLGLWLRWDPSRTQAYISTESSRFSIVDTALNAILPLPFYTLPTKCVASTASTTYCFIPQEPLPSDQTFPEDYLKRAYFTVDDLYTISADGGVQKILTGGMHNVPEWDASSPRILGNKLYFINRYDQSVYSIDLTKLK